MSNSFVIKLFCMVADQSGLMMDRAASKSAHSEIATSVAGIAGEIKGLHSGVAAVNSLGPALLGTSFFASVSEGKSITSPFGGALKKLNRMPIFSNVSAAPVHDQAQS